MLEKERFFSFLGLTSISNFTGDLILWLGLQMSGNCVCIFLKSKDYLGFPGGTVKNLPANAGDVGPVPGWGRSPGGGHSNPLQYSCLEHPTDRGAWQATVHSVAELDTTEAT